MNKIILTNLLILQAYLLCGQSDILSDTTFQLSDAVTLNHCLVTRDGRVACVGEQKSVGGDIKGYFLLVDPRKGEILKEQAIGNVQKCGFTSVAEADDGSFYTVGYTETGNPKRGMEAWLIRFDETGSKSSAFQDLKFGGAGNDRFEDRKSVV